MYLSGNLSSDRGTPLAQAYAGHQFGHFTMLGDGRAILLGEKMTANGERVDIQLKGSGQTPYSRRGDGRATLYSMLREYLISEAMHHLGIPTTRSLAVTTTGEKVFRGEMHDGAVLTRTATSHIRVGTFEYARRFCSSEELQTLTSYTINRHYPELNDSENPVLDLLQAVMNRQIDLVVNWMRVGFIHGVMNTDNMSIAGETIDYGPCAFMNVYNPRTVFSSIDVQGRYDFNNQSIITLWNLTIFANTLLPMISDDPKVAVELAEGVLGSFKEKFAKHWYKMMYQKLGILKPNQEDKDLVDDLLVLMEKKKLDYTQTFLSLQPDQGYEPVLSNDQEFKEWRQRWKDAHIRSDQTGPSLDFMNQTNPKVIPRNHWVEHALNQAVLGNNEPYEQLLQMLSNPYGQHPNDLKFHQIPDGFDARYQTFCGT